MLRAFFKGRIAAFERDWHYDASYLRELIDVSPLAFLQFGIVTSLGKRGGAPAAAMTAVSIVAARAEDCGPCTQLGVDMATHDGVPPALLRAILAGDEAAMGDDAALAYRYARASLARSTEADASREEIVRRWGKRGLVALALALTMTRVYPTLKYALGHGRACTRIEVAGAPVPLGLLAS